MELIEPQRPERLPRAHRQSDEPNFIFKVPKLRRGGRGFYRPGLLQESERFRSRRSERARISAQATRASPGDEEARLAAARANLRACTAKVSANGAQNQAVEVCFLISGVQSL